MENIFKHSSYNWVKYSKYIKIEGEEDNWYVAPAPDAKVKIFNPLDNAEQMVIDALNVGWTCMNSNSSDEDKEQAVFRFIYEYGLLGFMTALPTTPKFIEYDSVYLMKNQFIKEETMSTDDYLDIFFPFIKPEIIRKSNGGFNWAVGGDRDMIALALTMTNRPMALNMTFQRGYAERYDWIVKQFKDWAFTFFTTVLYYDNDDTDDTTGQIYREAMAAFDGISPSYHIELLDKPTIVWDFHSLLLAIQMMFSFMLTDEHNPLKICKHCNTVFKASRPSAVFCSPQCKNRYNVYKSRKKDKN